MVEPENKLISQVNAGMMLVIEQRLKALADLGLLETQTIPVFEEATQTAAQLLEMPICILGFLDNTRHWFKSAVGLSQLGLMNQLAQERQIPIRESFCNQVVESRQVLAISDALTELGLTNSTLLQRYGIRAYLGAPLFDVAGNCLGAIAVMDLKPRTFTIKQMKFLELMARWSMSEFELNRRQKDTQEKGFSSGSELNHSPKPQNVSLLTLGQTVYTEESAVAKALCFPDASISDSLSTIQIKFKILEQLTQELRTPLTSILGMANVVSREIYGPLTTKQREYLEIIQNSGRYLLSLVNEISQMGTLDECCNQTLNLTPVDVEMLCQQVLNCVEEAAKRREQQTRLSLEPGRSRVWILDKEKVRQLLYHLVSSMIQSATNGSNIRLHISQKNDCLNLTVSVSHPWLGEGLVPVAPQFEQLVPEMFNSLETEPVSSPSTSAVSSDSFVELGAQLLQSNDSNCSSDLRLLLSYNLAQLHGGKIDLQGTPELGYRYVVSLPDLGGKKESL